MSTPVDNQTWQLNNLMGHSVGKAQITQKRGQAQIAQSQRVAGKQNSNIDSVRAAPADQESPPILTKIFGPEGQPRIPNPSSQSKIYEGASEPEKNLIALIGIIMSIQAKKDSNFWSNLWKFSTLNMQMQTQLAPLAGGAILAQFNAQKEATLAKHAMSQSDGVIHFGSFGLGLVSTGVDEYQNGGKQSPTDPASENEDETKLVDPDTLPIDAVSKSSADQVLNQKNESWQAQASKTWDHIKGKLAGAQQRINGFLNKAPQYTEQMGRASVGMIGLNDAKYKCQEEAFNGIATEAASTSRAANTYSQFYDKNFNLLKDLREGSGQNLNYAMNLLLQASNSITHSAVSMFQG